MTSASDYSFLDRMIHRLAFSTRAAQTVLADMEDRLYARQLDTINPEQAVLVASLPRAGTTLLLEALESSPEFCTHTYRNMPFLMLPLWWSKLSRSFHTQSTLQERAHGDGMLVGTDSPEAFEEALWTAFWQDQYTTDTIKPWDSRLRYDEFEHFFRQHIKKLILLHQKADSAQPRYLSKNNLNIARLGYLAKILPNATLVVPFRHPLQHAASLLKQHLNFLAIHQQNPFARDYMRDIGHFDFGENLKPVNFNNWRQQHATLVPTDISFWLRYWVETYATILANQSPSLTLFSYDLLCEQPHPSLNQLADRIGLKDRTALLASADRAAPPKPHPVNIADVAPALLEQANTLYEKLRQRSINAPSHLQSTDKSQGHPQPA